MKEKVAKEVSEGMKLETLKKGLKSLKMLLYLAQNSDNRVY